MSKKTDDFIALARERLATALALDLEDRREAISDNEFAQGGSAQWLPADVKARQDAGRPILTWNRLHIFSAQVVNDGRQNKPAIKVAAMDGGTKETAEFFQGRIRHIEYESDADIAYDTARDQQVTSGRGFIRVRTRFTPKSFNQEIRIERIEDQFSVVFDHAAREYDRSDAEWCMVITTMSREKFKAQYGEKRAIVGANWYMDQENPAPAWIGVGIAGEDVQVAEYWHKEHKSRTLCDLHTGGSAYKDELPDDFPPELIVDEREEDEITVVQSIINGVETLEETDWLTDGIPIFPQWGRESFVNGKRRTASLIRNAKDPQRLVNIYVSNIAEQIGQMPKSPYIAAEGQITNHEDDWENANTNPKAVLLYKPQAIGGSLPGAPQRVVNEPPIQALTIGLNQAIDAIKASMGIFDASLGANAREISGLAIEKRKREGDNANFHFHDNEARTRRSIGRMLLQMIPLLDKGAKKVPTRSVDGKTNLVPVNQHATDEQTGAPIHHDLTSGDYGCAVETGSSFNSQREEAFQIYSQIASADKGFMQVAGDVFFRAMDAPGSDQLADRYEKLLPQALQSQGKNGQQQSAQQLQQLQGQMQQMAAQHQQLVATVHQQAGEIEAKSAELASRERIASLQEETKRVIALATLDAKDGLGLLMQQVNAIKEAAGQAHDMSMQDAAQTHQSNLAGAEHAHVQQMQSDQQAHDQAQAEAAQAHAAQQASQSQQATADQATQAQDANAQQQLPKAA